MVWFDVEYGICFTHETGFFIFYIYLYSRVKSIFYLTSKTFNILFITFSMFFNMFLSKHEIQWLTMNVEFISDLLKIFTRPSHSWKCKKKLISFVKLISYSILSHFISSISAAKLLLVCMNLPVPVHVFKINWEAVIFFNICVRSIKTCRQNSFLIPCQNCKHEINDHLSNILRILMTVPSWSRKSGIGTGFGHRTWFSFRNKLCSPEGYRSMPAFHIHTNTLCCSHTLKL